MAHLDHCTWWLNSPNIDNQDIDEEKEDLQVDYLISVSIFR